MSHSVSQISFPDSALGTGTVVAAYTALVVTRLWLRPMRPNPQSAAVKILF